MRRWFALGLVGWLVTTSLLTYSPRPTLAQDGAALGEAPYLADGAVVAAGDSEIVMAAAVPAVDISSRSASANFYFSYYTAEPAISWTGSQANCTPGTTSASFKAAVINRVAFYRAMAGVPSNVGVAADSSTAGQQAALMFSRNNQLSHSPANNWACYTSTGAQAAASSNIALGAHGTYAIDAYMRDAGGNNAPVGHRRWILFPQTQSFGTGDIPPSGGYNSANALSVWDSNVGGPRPGTRDPFVAWPPAGYVPYQVVYPRWSFSYPNAGFGSASVTVTLDGKSVPVSIDSSTATGYGENTIVFRPDNLDAGAAWPNPGTDKIYTVKISGVNVGGQSKTFTYTVKIFDPSTSDPGPATATRTPTKVSATPTRTPTKVSGTATRTPTKTATPLPGGFVNGDKVKTTTNVNMRSGAGTSYSVVSLVSANTQLTVTGSPKAANGYTWYPVKLSSGSSGWIASNYLLLVSTTREAPTATRTPTSKTASSPSKTPTRTPTSKTASSPSKTPTRTPTRAAGSFINGDKVKTTTNVNMRSGAGTSYGVVSVISANTQLTVTGSPKAANGYTWYPVKPASGSSGWIASTYLKLVSSAPAATATRTPTTKVTSAGATATRTPTSKVTGASDTFPKNSTVYVTSNLNIRSGPGTGYSSKGVASKGTAATVTGAPTVVGSVSWYPLNVPGIGTGWASGQYLSATVVKGPSMPTATATKTVAATKTATPTRTPTKSTSQGIAAAPSETPMPPTSTATSVPTQTATVVDLITATSAPEISLAVDGDEEAVSEENAVPAATQEIEPTIPLTPNEPAVVSSDGTEEEAAIEIPATETPVVIEPEIPAEVPTEESLPVEEAPTEVPPTEVPVEVAPAWLPVERVQRSPDSQPGQVLVDQDASTVWFANGAGQPLAMFVLDLGQESSISQIRWLTGESGLSGTLYLSVSFDGENWTDIDPTYAYGTGDGWTVLDAGTAGRYVRFVFVNDAGAEWLGGCSEVQLLP